jgi:CubicO group peptidase (beta-lactamase class C family)
MLRAAPLRNAFPDLPMKRVVFALLTFASVATAQIRPDQKIDSLFGFLNRAPSPGLSIAVVRDGKMIFARGYGLASLEHNVPITPSTVFDLASVSKQFTGMAVAMLVDEGRISLGDDIRKYIPELSDVGHKVTIDHLVHHTSGYRDWPGTLALAGWRFDDVISFEQILNFAYRQRTLNFTPGAEYLYSNTGYNLLAEMVARVSGKPFRAFIEERILGPLGMKDSQVLDDHRRIIANRAYGYSTETSGFRLTGNELTAMGSSSLFSTASDMAKWMINFETRAVGTARVHALMRSQTRLNDGSENAYAFGIAHGRYRGVPMFNHSGGWASFATFVMHFPEQRFSVVVLSNHASAVAPGRVAQQIADLYLEKELGVATQASAPAPATSPVLSAALLDRYTGMYRLAPGWWVRIRRDGSSLRTMATREGEFPMTPRTDSTFWVSAYSAEMLFRSRADSVTLVYRGITAPKVSTEGDLTPPRLQDYAGVYESAELGTSYEVVVTGDTLIMRHARHPRITLTRAYGDEFAGSVGFMSGVEFVRDASRRVTGMVVRVDGRSRDVRFTRR